MKMKAKKIKIIFDIVSIISLIFFLLSLIYFISESIMGSSFIATSLYMGLSSVGVLLLSIIIADLFELLTKRNRSNAKLKKEKN